MRLARRVLTIIIDTITFECALICAYLLRFEITIPDKEWSNIAFFALVGIAVHVFSFALAGIYNRVWRYATVRDVWVIVQAATLTVLTLGFIDYFTAVYYLPRTVIAMIWILIIAGTGGSRFGWRLYSEKHDKDRRIVRPCKPALIVGAGDAGVMVTRELQRAKSDLLPIGFIDDDPIKKGKVILGLPVLGTRKDIATVVHRYRVQEILIAMPSTSGVIVREIVELCKTTPARIKILPDIHEVINGKVFVSKLRDVEVEDLLRREPTQVDFEQITAYLKGRRVLVTGAGGSIGSELCRQIARVRPRSIILVDHGENSLHAIFQELQEDYPEVGLIPYVIDIKERPSVERVFSEHRPHAVFHAAAHKHVPLMEPLPEEALKNNVWGTRLLAEVAVNTDVERFVLISSDKAVHPSSVMGASKRFAELVVQSFSSQSNTRFAVVRFGNVLGSNGSVVPIFKKQIANGGPVTVTHPEMVRFFMTIPEAVALVIQAGAMATGGEIFVLDMGKPVKILDLATDLIRLSGLEPYHDINIVFTGVRPGEKLYEELFSCREELEQTNHDRIMKIVNARNQSRQFEVPIARILRADYNELLHMSREDAIRWLEQVNPGYSWREEGDGRKCLSVVESVWQEAKGS